MIVQQTRPSPLGLAAATLALVLLGAAPLRAAAPPLQATCDVTFSGTSTLHGFEGSAPTLTFPMEAAAPYGASVAVAVRSLVTGNDTRDSNMWAMFDADHWPQIRAAFAAVDPSAASSSRRLPFALTIRDVTRDIVATITTWQQETDRVTFDADFDVSLSAFGLTAPSVLGLVHVGDVVHVVVHAVVSAPKEP